MVNAIRTQKIIDEELTKNLEFLVFELIDMNFNSEQQLKYAQNLGFKICNYTIIDNINNENLENNTNNIFFKLLEDFKNKSNYDIDGIIVTDNNLHKRNTKNNPDYSFAFKVNRSGELSKVVNIEWNVSKWKIGLRKTENAINYVVKMLKI